MEPLIYLLYLTNKFSFALLLNLANNFSNFFPMEIQEIKQRLGQPAAKGLIAAKTSMLLNVARRLAIH